MPELDFAEAVNKRFNTDEFRETTFVHEGRTVVGLRLDWSGHIAPNDGQWDRTGMNLPTKTGEGIDAATIFPESDALPDGHPLKKVVSVAHHGGEEWREGGPIL